MFINLGLADMSLMSIFNALVKLPHMAKTYFMRIKDDLSMLTIDSTTADNGESTFGPATNDLENYNGNYTNIYSSYVETHTKVQMSYTCSLKLSNHEPG